jgi:hypothetical protein
METIAVFANDVQHARHLLHPMLISRAPTRWVLVAVPPTLTRHTSRFVSHAALEQWRHRWADTLFAQLEPELKAAGGTVECMLAKRPLVNVTARLQAREPQLRLLDARSPALGHHDEPIEEGQPDDKTENNWITPVAVTGLGATVLALAVE